MTIRIMLGGLCFGLIVEAGLVVRAAPVAGWTVGKEWSEVELYWQRRGAMVEKLPVDSAE